LPPRQFAGHLLPLLREFLCRLCQIVQRLLLGDLCLLRVLLLQSLLCLAHAAGGAAGGRGARLIEPLHRPGQFVGGFLNLLLFLDEPLQSLFPLGTFGSAQRLLRLLRQFGLPLVQRLNLFRMLLEV
jgi:hypothetical protein